MPTRVLFKRLDPSPIAPESTEFSRELGAVTSFLGVVRELEDGRPLVGIRYSCYESMAWGELDKVIAEATEAHGAHDLSFHHRLGMVPVAEPSVWIRIATGHSAEALALCQFYLKAVKTRLPIWKEPVFVEEKTAAMAKTS